ncbi:MAG: acetylornithine/succinylornithine family transaminase [Clostridia bacterium]|nr:acetylornithine/succinylornithine family transaminase [Clostridia bacterium]
MSITSLDNTYVASTYGRFQVELDHGKGAKLFDTNGKEYIDMGTGIAVNVFGVCDNEWNSAVKAQLDKLAHTSNLYYTEPCAKLAELLCSKTGMKKVFFSNSGAEANECAIKTARRYSFNKYGEGRSTIVTLKQSFHGRTVTTLAATGQDSFHTEFGPFTEGFVYAEANNTAEAIRLIEENNACAIMMELVQGEGGVMKLDENFVTDIADYCNKNDVLLVIDEVQTGNGRTGSLYAFQQFGITPDIVTTAKGLGGGLPIGATMLGAKTENVLTPGSHGSTFGGNPVCCAGAYNIISRIDDKLLADVKAKSEYIFSELSGAKGIKTVSGMGLMVGLETEKDAKGIVTLCREKGVLVLTAKTKVRLLPPLNITAEELETAVNVIKECAK